MDPLPDIDRAYSMVLNIEKHKEVNIAFTENIENAMAVKQEVQYRNNTRKTDLQKKTDK